jgi:hypothetical protein
MLANSDRIGQLPNSLCELRPLLTLYLFGSCAAHRSGRPATGAAPTWAGIIRGKDSVLATHITACTAYVRFSTGFAEATARNQADGEYCSADQYQPTIHGGPHLLKKRNSIEHRDLKRPFSSTETTEK